MFVHLWVLIAVGAVTGAAGGSESSAASTAVVTSAQAIAATRVDELWKRRDEPGSIAESKKILDEALAVAPNDYGLLWRAARHYFWLSDDPDISTEDRTRLGKQGWDLAESAIVQNPNDVAGHLWAVTTMGNYSLGLGVLRAMGQRIEFRFLARIREAERLAPTYQDGAIPMAWGRYYDKLPWPKRDVQKSLEYYQKVLVINPYSLRARFYMADLQMQEGNPAEAKRLIDEIAAAPVGRYDAPEERRCKVLAARMVPRVMARLR